MPTSLRDLLQVVLCTTSIVYWTVFDTTNWFCGCCFWFSANDSSIEQICLPCYRDRLLAAYQKMCVEPKQKYKLTETTTKIQTYRNAGNCPYSQNFGIPW